MLPAQTKNILDTIRKLYRRNSKVTLYKVINKMHPSQMANIYRYLNQSERENIFKYILRMDGIGEFIKELDETLTKDIFESLSRDEITTILKHMTTEDIAELVDELDDNISDKIQNLLDQEELVEIKEVLKYDDESAGRIMSHEFMAFDSDLTVQETIDRFQEYGEEIEMPFYLYITDKTQRMIGVLSLRQLLLHSSSAKLKSFMEKEFIYVSPDDDQEKVANIVSEYNYLALPVLNEDNKLVGIITVDDMMDVIREEATEDMLKMAGAGDDEDILLKSVFENARTRFPWLMASWIGGLIAFYTIHSFQNILDSTIILAGFIPIIIGMGGNIGTQTSTILVRGLATGHVNTNEFYKVIFKEVKVGFILGLLYGTLLGSLTSILYQNNILLGLTVGISIALSMLIACSIASIIPILLYKIDMDPAIAAGPFVTTAIDVVGVMVYFVIASKLL